MLLKNLKKELTDLDGNPLKLVDPNSGKVIVATFGLLYEQALMHQDITMQNGQAVITHPLTKEETQSRYNAIRMIHGNEEAEVDLKTASLIEDNLTKIGLTVVAAALAIQNLE